MLYGLLAGAAIVVHLAFILFVVLGGLAVFRWPKLAWLHVPAFLWGAGIELVGWVCPLTYVENHFRRLAQQGAYDTGFIERYLLPLIYPEMLFPGGFPRIGFILLGIIVLIVNGVIYWRVWKAWRKGV